MAERDDLEALRALWREVRPPAAGAAMDAETERAVEWMRAAWRAVEPPALPSALTRKTRRAAGARVTPAVLALAAALLAALRLLFGVGVSGPVPQDHAASHAGPGTADDDEHPGAPAAPGTDEGASPLVAIAPDRIELRRGTVRLILLRQDEAADDPTSGEPR